LYYLFAAGLTEEPRVACAPGPSAFADLAPAGTLFPVITANPEYPALSTAVLAPAVVSPLAAQVYQTQQQQLQGLVGTSNADLTQAANSAGQSGAVNSPGDWSDAAQVYPMNLTTNQVIARTPLAQRVRRKGPPRNTNSPGVPWGGAAMNVPGGGCAPSGISGWGLLFLLAGASAIVAAVLSE
jgi:hypothetical protein